MPSRPTLLSLNSFIAQARSWISGNTMPPSEVLTVQDNIAQARSQFVVNASPLRNAGFELVLRGVERLLERSIHNIVNNFDNLDPQRDIPPGSANYFIRPLYCAQAWKACNAWVLRKRGQQGLYDFAQKLKDEAMFEHMNHKGSINELSDIYAALNTLHALVPKPHSSPPNPVADWAKLMTTRKLKGGNDEPVFVELLDLSQRLGLPTQQASEVLRVLSWQIYPHPMLPAARTIRALDIMLNNGVSLPCLDQLPEHARDYIRSNPGYRKTILTHVAGLSSSSPRSAAPQQKM